MESLAQMALVLSISSLESAGLFPFPGSHSQLPVPSDLVTLAGEGKACTPGAVADLRACTTLPHGWNVQLASSAVCSEAEMAEVWGLFSLPFQPLVLDAPCLFSGLLGGLRWVPRLSHQPPPHP